MEVTEEHKSLSVRANTRSVRDPRDQLVVHGPPDFRTRLVGVRGVLVRHLERRGYARADAEDSAQDVLLALLNREHRLAPLAEEELVRYAKRACQRAALKQVTRNMRRF